MHAHAYMLHHIHTYKHTYIHTYIHTRIHTYRTYYIRTARTARTHARTHAYILFAINRDKCNANLEKLHFASNPFRS